MTGVVSGAPVGTFAQAAARVRNGAARVPAAASFPVVDTTISEPVGTGAAVVVVVVVGGTVVVTGATVVAGVGATGRNAGLGADAAPGPAAVVARSRTR